MKIYTKALLLLPLLMILAGPLDAVQPIILKKQVTEVPVGPFMEILEDRGKEYGISDVASEKLSPSFVRSAANNPAFGYTSSVYWTRFRVKNTNDKNVSLCLEIPYPLIDSIMIYVLDNRGIVVDHRVGGDGYPFDQREVKYQNMVFHFWAPPLSDRTYYARFETDGAMNLSMVLWDTVSFFGQMSWMQMMLGIYYGAMLVMLVYNLFIFFSVRDLSYLYYVFYYLFFVLFQLALNGLAYQYIWPDWVWWQNNVMPLLIFLSMIFAAQFARHFLHMKAHLPKTDRVLAWLVYLFIAILPVTILADYKVMLNVAAVLAIVLAVALTWLSIRIFFLGYRPARYYCIAWTVFWIGTVIYALKMFAILPDNVVTRWVHQSASLLEVTLLSLGLADRINCMKVDLENLNVNLETMVEVRTRELYDVITEMKKKENEFQIEFELAGNIQQGILPHTPFYYEGIKIVSFYRAMGKVGGDFFDIFHMKGGYLGVLIADASGHGMPAAFITALAKISFTEAIQRSLFPSDIYRHVNKELVDAIKTDDFLTAFFLVISPNFEVMYGNASHQMAMVLRREDGSLQEWDTAGLFVGALPAANSMYEDKQDVLNYGDRVILYTDGLVEAKNSAGQKFGDEALRRIVKETQDLPLDEAREAILYHWHDFIKATPLNDDVTFLIVEIDQAYRDLMDYREKGFRMLSKKMHTDAVTELLKALTINPRDEKTHLYLGECYLKTGEYEKSITHLLQYLKNNEVDANVWFHLSKAYFNQSEYEMALKTSQKAAQLRMNFSNAMIISAYSSRQLGMAGDAVKTLKRILTFDPANEVAINELQDIEKIGQ